MFGSQNFGYNDKNSDKDWLELVYPTWEDIVNNRATSKEHIDNNGSHTKIYDIRLLRGMIEKCNINSTQIFYSVEQYDYDDMAWFIQNRERIIRATPDKLAHVSAKMIHSMIRAEHPTPKDVVRATAFANLVDKIINTDYLGTTVDPKLRAYRGYLSSIEHTDEYYKIISTLKARSDKLLIESEKYESRRDYEIINQVHNEITRLVKDHLIKTL